VRAAIDPATNMRLKFYQKPTCTSCRKAKAFLLERGADLDLVDLNQGLSIAELDKLIGGRDYRQFLNTRNELYRERRMKENPPSREEALRLMAKNPNLIKRPVVVKGRDLALGFDEARLAEIAGS
jgi:Spx/MgsR family transcriptional regulator